MEKVVSKQFLWWEVVGEVGEVGEDEGHTYSKGHLMLQIR